MTFDEAFQILVDPQHEGAYTPGKGDPGGETKYGISKRQYPGVDIKALTLDEAKRLYRRDYWSLIRADELPATIRFDVFDTAVNVGVQQAIKFLQRAVGVNPDGIIGPKTINAVQGPIHPAILEMRFYGHRLDFINNLPTWPVFGRGWVQRIADNLIAN